MSVIEKTANELTALFKAALLDISPQRNDLSRSELIKSVESRYDENSIELWAYEYAIYIDSGRRPQARRVPIAALLDWIKRYNINDGTISDNSLAFAIQASIFKNGIKPRPYLDQFTEDAVELVTKNIFEYFSVELVRTFEDLKKR